MKAPPCFLDDDQYKVYMDAVNECGLLDKQEIDVFNAHGYCVDCTPGFKKEMIEQNRCQHANVEFEKVPVVIGRVKWYNLEGRRMV